MDIEILIQAIPKATKSWNENDVLIWLNLILLPQFTPLFRSHSINGSILLNMNYIYLQQKMKIKSKIIIKKILSWVAYLREKEDLICSKLIITSQIRQSLQCLGNCINTSQITTKKQHSQEDQSQTKSHTTTIRNPYPEDSMCLQNKKDHQTLYVYERPLQQNKFIKCQGQDITFGKSTKNNFVIFLTDIQPFHSKIIHQNGHHYLDFDPRDAVWKIIKRKIKLQDEQIYEMGQSILHITVECSCLKIVMASSYNIHQKLIFFGEQTDRIRIGRRNLCQIAVPNDRTMSALHGKFSYQQNNWYFQDYQTTNGTWIKCQQRQLIVDQFTFRLGRNSNLFQCKLQYNDDDDVASSSSSRVSIQRCKFCRKNEKNSFYRPCYHHFSCYDCAIRNSHCQICSQEISQVVKIYK